MPPLRFLLIASKLSSQPDLQNRPSYALARRPHLPHPSRGRQRCLEARNSGCSRCAVSRCSRQLHVVPNISLPLFNPHRGRKEMQLPRKLRRNQQPTYSRSPMPRQERSLHRRPSPRPQPLRDRPPLRLPLGQPALSSPRDRRQPLRGDFTSSARGLLHAVRNSGPDRFRTRVETALLTSRRVL